jgi:hypothetical protein
MLLVDNIIATHNACPNNASLPQYIFFIQLEMRHKFHDYPTHTLHSLWMHPMLDMFGTKRGTQIFNVFKMCKISSD